MIVVENLPVPFDRRVWQEASALRDAGWTVSVISPMGMGHDRTRERIDGINVYRHPQAPDEGSVRGYIREYANALRWQSRLLRRVAEDVGFDVIHICNPPDVLFLPALPWRRAGAALVFDHHDRSPELFEAKYGRKGPLHAALRAAERMTFHAADAVIATNETHRQVAMSRGGRAAEDVFIVRSSPPLPAGLAPAPPRLQPDGTWRVGYVGVMGDQDGVDLLLHAAAHVRNARGRRDVSFVLAGDGQECAALKGLAGTLGLNGSVAFTGFLERSRLLEVASTFDVGVGPDPKNPYNDGCTMNKILEYMALGKPMVQFDLVEGRRTAGDASLYVSGNDPRSLGDAILTLVDDLALRRRLSEEGLRRFRELAWDRQVPRLLGAYERAREVRAASGRVRSLERAPERA